MCGGEWSFMAVYKAYWEPRNRNKAFKYQKEQTLSPSLFFCSSPWVVYISSLLRIFLCLLFLANALDSEENNYLAILCGSVCLFIPSISMVCTAFATKGMIWCCMQIETFFGLLLFPCKLVIIHYGKNNVRNMVTLIVEFIFSTTASIFVVPALNSIRLNCEI